MTRFAGESVDISSYMPERNFTELGQIGQKSRGLLTQSALYSKAKVAIGGLKGSAAALGGKLKASAIEEAGRAQARATQSAGMWDMIGTIGTGVIGGIKNKMGAGPENPADWMGKQDTSNFTPDQVTEWNRARYQEGQLFNQNNPGLW